jgi:hypothetical protein
MSDTTTKGAAAGTPAAVSTFNNKVSDLLKASTPSELTEIFSHPASLLRAADNQNQNQGSKRA